MLDKYRNHLFIFLAGLSFSGISIFSAILSKNKVDLFTQVFGRMFIACIFVLIISLLFRKKLQIEKTSIPYIMINGVLFLFGYTTFSLSIFFGASIAKAIVIVYAYPIYAVFLAYLLLKEQPSIKQILAVIVSFVGLFFLLEVWSIKNLSQISIGDFFALINGLCYASLIIWGVKIRRTIKISPFNLLFFSLITALPLVVVSGIILNFLNIPLFYPQFNFSALTSNWLPLACLGIFGSGLSYVFLYLGSPKLKPLTTSILLLSEPIVVYFYSALFMGQPLSIWGIIGMFSIMISVLLT